MIYLSPQSYRTYISYYRQHNKSWSRALAHIPNICEPCGLYNDPSRLSWSSSDHTLSHLFGTFFCATYPTVIRTIPGRCQINLNYLEYSICQMLDHPDNILITMQHQHIIAILRIVCPPSHATTAIALE